MNQPEHTETDVVPAAAEPNHVAEPPAPPRSRRSGGGALAGLALVIAVVAVAAFLWVWQQQQDLAQRLATVSQTQPTVDTTAIATLQDQLQAMQRQVADLSKAVRNQPQPASVDLQPLEARIAALENAKPVAAAPPPDLGPLQQKLDSVAAEANTAKADAGKAAEELAAVQQQLQGAEAQAVASATKAETAQLLARAQMALDNGEPLGTIPGAPPALARFATTAPPTASQLRLTFPAAAAAAEKASRPSTAGESFGERVLHNVESMLVVKEGDHVLVGSTASHVLGEAQARLDAGDLVGALHELDSLDPAAAAAMADWRGQAQALLDARMALSQMARA